MEFNNDLIFKGRIILPVREHGAFDGIPSRDHDTSVDFCNFDICRKSLTRFVEGFYTNALLFKNWIQEAIYGII